MLFSNLVESILALSLEATVDQFAGTSALSSEHFFFPFLVMSWDVATLTDPIAFSLSYHFASCI